MNHTLDDMKPQQRKFIVERKFARRPAAKGPASIWADTDLKTLVREVEADAPHLFEPPIVDKVLESAADARTRTSSEAEVPDNDVASAVANISVPSADEPQIVPSQQDVVSSSGQLSRPAEKPSKRRPPQARRSQRDVDTNGLIVSTRAKLETSSKTDEPGPTNDELIELEQQNRWLKRMLVERLRQQNSVLRTMLARF